MREEVELIPRRVLFGNPDRSSPSISPDGRHVGFLAPVDGVLNVWVGPAEEPEAAEPVTEDRERGIRMYFWAYTNDHVIYLQDRRGDENWRVYLTDVAGRETRDLTPLEGVQARVMKVGYRFPDTVLVGLNDRDPRYHDVYRLDLKSGERELMLQHDRFAGFTIDDDYNIRLAHEFDDEGNMQLWEAAGDGKWDLFTTIPREDTLTTGPAGFSKDGTKLFMRDSRGRDTAALTVLDLETGGEEVLVEDERVDVGGVLRHPTERHVEAVSVYYKRPERVFLDEEIREEFEHLETLEEGEVSVAGRTLADDRWLVGYWSDTAPSRYYSYDRDEKQADFLFVTRDDLLEQPLVPMHPVSIESRDGRGLVSYLSLPPGSAPDGGHVPSEPQPMVLYVHGGPWGRDTWGFSSAHQWLANRGYAVLSVNFRGSTGFGKEFVNAGDQEWAGRMHDDLIDGVDWAVQQGVAAPDRVAIMGGSYGGYATLVGLTFTPEVFACGVDLVGPSNLITLLESMPEYWKPMLEMFCSRVGDFRRAEGRKLLEDRSPLHRVESICRPLLIGQGANDPRVKRAESDQIVEAMQDRDIPVTYVLYPDEGHGMARPENRLSFYAVAESFLGTHLGGRFEPVGQDFEGSSIQILCGADQIPGLPEDYEAPSE